MMHCNNCWKNVHEDNARYILDYGEDGMVEVCPTCGDYLVLGKLPACDCCEAEMFKSYDEWQQYLKDKDLTETDELVCNECRVEHAQLKVKWLTKELDEARAVIAQLKDALDAGQFVLREDGSIARHVDPSQLHFNGERIVDMVAERDKLKAELTLERAKNVEIGREREDHKETEVELVNARAEVERLKAELAAEHEGLTRQQKWAKLGGTGPVPCNSDLEGQGLPPIRDSTADEVVTCKHDADKATVKCADCDTRIPKDHPFTVCDACWDRRDTVGKAPGVGKATVDTLLEVEKLKALLAAERERRKSCESGWNTMRLRYDPPLTPTGEKKLELAIRLLARANEHVNGPLRPEITDFITKIRTKGRPLLDSD